MQSTASRYIYTVYSTTMVVGLLLGCLILFVKDKASGMYDDDWDNPFYNFILFLLIGVGESIIPLFVFLGIGKLLISRKADKNLLYVLGLLCTVAPFWQLYYMVNEGYHRTNVLIYAGCFIIALSLSFRLFKSHLASLYVKG